jgi:hypothetical protein
MIDPGISQAVWRVGDRFQASHIVGQLINRDRKLKVDHCDLGRTKLAITMPKRINPQPWSVCIEGTSWKIR